MTGPAPTLFLAPMNPAPVLALCLALLPGQAPSRPGVVLVAEGIGGLNVLHASVGLGFRSAGLPHEVRLFAWSHGLGRFLRDLQDIRHVLAKGRELADVVLELKRQDPSRPVWILAHSAGAGVAIRAAELLPPDTLERVVLLSAALSPAYDLRPALRGSRRGIVSYFSPGDRLVLCWGTRQFGTIDRAYEASAGCGGFRLPLGVGEDARYGKLIQVPWTPAMIWQGNWGQHNGPVMPSFLAADVAKWLL